MASISRDLPARIIYFFIALSGFATLSWEVIWQIKSTLALGVSAWGTAITLIVTMAGLSIGSFLMGKALHKGSPVQALRLYGLLEIIIGVAGLFLMPAFSILAKLDSIAYAGMPSSISLVYILGIILVCGIPTLCMGATLPVFGLISREYQVSIAKLYSLNTLGAAAGVLVVALIVIPLLGVTHTIWAISSLNIIIGTSACLFFADGWVSAPSQQNDLDQSQLPPASLTNIIIVFVTGFATFTLEIAWFRSLLSVYPNTTEVFAVLLACMLLALGLAAKKVPSLKKKKKLLGPQLCIAGILILLWTPLIERIGNLSIYYKQTAAKLTAPSHLTLSSTSGWLLDPITNSANWMGATSYALNFLIFFLWVSLIIIPSMRFLGVAFPWILDDQHSSFAMGKLYAMNTLAAVIGSILAAWFLLPTIGFAQTAWIAGALVAASGVLILPIRKRFIWAPLSIMALVVAIFFQTGIGKTHAQGFYATDMKGVPAKILGFSEGPEATISAVEYLDNARALLINSTLASRERGLTDDPSVHYMAWMGHLPMLLNPDAKDALVICFGTGQTSNAVRKENPKQLDIVDINAYVFNLGQYFKSNQKVLDDPRVKKIVMDGRAYLRRTKKTYDVITLEPMPPGSAGMNALYSKEFYELARAKLNPKGVIAQWLPLHGVAPYYTASIAKTFIHEFPNSVLWLDPGSRTGILLGTIDNNLNLETRWPILMNKSIRGSLALNTKELQQYSQYGDVISDNNQLLAYGKVLYVTNLQRENIALLHRVNNKISIESLDLGMAFH